MRTFIQTGDSLTLTAPSGGVVAGTPLLIGSLVVVPTTTVAQTLPFAGDVEGVFTCPKEAGSAWTEGQVLYFDSVDSTFKTAKSATARRAGVAVADAASAATTGTVLLVNVCAAVNVD